MMRRAGQALAMVSVTILLAACVRAGFDPLHTRSPDASSPDASSSDLRRADGTDDSPQPTPPLKLFLALQGKSASYLRALTLDVAAPSGKAVTLDGPPLRLTGIQGSDVRGLTVLSDGAFLSGSGWLPTGQLISGDGSAILGMLTLSSPGAPASQIPGNLHGLCLLPNGHLVVGEYGDSPGNAVSEYAVAGDTATFLRAVHSTTLNGGTLSHCTALSNTELYMAELDAATDANGDVVRLTLSTSTGQWSEVDRFDISAFDSLHGSAGTAAYTFVIHSDGQLYIFPMRRFGQRFKSLIRCKMPNISAASCEPRGALPPDTDVSNGPDTLNVAIQIPGSDDMLFATNQRIYRYRLASDTYEVLMDMWDSFTDLKDGTGAPDQLNQVRGMLIKP